MARKWNMDISWLVEQQLQHSLVPRPAVQIFYLTTMEKIYACFSAFMYIFNMKAPKHACFHVIFPFRAYFPPPPPPPPPPNVQLEWKRVYCWSDGGLSEGWVASFLSPSHFQLHELTVFENEARFLPQDGLLF